MADKELLITINADAKNAAKAFDDVRSQTEDLEGQLATVAKISAVGFAALTAEVGLAVHAFAEAEAASRKLEQSFQTQGIFSKELVDSYKAQAVAISELTGIDDDAITSAQATAQAYLGETKLTKELTLAIADLAERKGIDLNSAAALVGKTIGTQTNALAREGLQLDDNATKTERYAKTLQFLEGRYSGAAEAANQGLGSLRSLQTAFGNLQEAIGERFAPLFEAAFKTLTKFINSISKNKELVDFTVSLIAAGFAVTGIGLAIPAVVTALGLFKGAMVAAGIASTTTGFAVKALVGATGIGLLVLLLTEVYLHWSTVWPRMVAIFKGFVQTITGISIGLAGVFEGLFTLNPEKIKKGLAEVLKAFSQGYDTATQTIVAKTEEGEKKQEAVKKEAAAKRRAEERAETARKVQLQEAQNELITLKLQEAAQTEIEIKTAQVDTLKQLGETQNATQIALLTERLEELKNLELAAQEEESVRDEEFAALRLEAIEETGIAEAESRSLKQQQEDAQLKASLDTRQAAQQKALATETKTLVDARNKKLQDEIQYGVVYAAIKDTLNSKEIQGTKQATGELTALTQSKNSTLKAIGKAASVAQITIKTAESAMNIYAGFSAIPFIGQALGIAGAAAAIAFGAEQVGTVLAAREGGIVPGGFGGGDRIPALLEPGELVTPVRSFEEVVTSVAQNRAQASGGSPGGGSGSLVIGFDGPEASRVLTARQVEDRALGISVEGRNT